MNWLREEPMAIYITQGRYTSDAVKGMVANPENREKAVADLMEKAREATCPVFHIRRVRLPLNNRGAERGSNGFRADRGRSVWRDFPPKDVARDDRQGCREG